MYLIETSQVVLFGGMNRADDSFMNDIWIMGMLFNTYIFRRFQITRNHMEEERQFDSNS